ncbi:hypothetical protein [Burkholderia ubonensis]|uniref:hypothetical protein n=1 Tax=Burkholderia ubonensis TaxID=101571 RepID=UPI000754234D|nr:hypothetical protein [Burkholderia ubonensis]KVP16906.1 hypothetical protein WJ84_01135 [Burkholderia ubonensis]KVP39971.1 hypothetical protein WJ87_07240 [Burkholderia ubonensis]
MALFLRQLPDGTRFMLCRTRATYLLKRREVTKGRTRLIVHRDGSDAESSLHHSCHVKPVVRAIK